MSNFGAGRGRTMCGHGHLHANPDAARMCDAAWRWSEQRKPRDPEVEALRAAILDAVRRGQQRFTNRATAATPPTDALVFSQAAHTGE